MRRSRSNRTRSSLGARSDLLSCLAVLMAPLLITMRAAMASDLVGADSFTVPSVSVPIGASGLAPAGRTLISLEGRRQLILYADGLTDSLDLNQYRDLGFNTLVVDVPWTTTPDYHPADALIGSAHRLGIPAVVRLRPGEPPTKLKLRVDPASSAYTTAAAAYLQAAAAHFRDVAGAAAIMLENDSEQHIQYDDQGFRAFLAGQYSRIDSLNKDWGSGYHNLDDVTLDSAVSIALKDYGGLSSSMLMVGMYRSGAYADLLAFWFRTLHETDSARPILLGRQDLPRAAIHAPAGCRGLVVAASAPGVAPVDVARQGGRFAAIVSLKDGDIQHPDALAPFLLQCLAHGAGGFAFPSWTTIQNAGDTRKGIRTLLHQLASEATALRPPQPTAAVIYQPLAPGAVEGGMDAPYGYMPQPADMEPGRLIDLLANGSIYGFPDILSPETSATEDFSRYHVLFLPSLFNPPPGLIASLTRFVTAGGVIVADFGFDLAETGSLDGHWTPAASSLFGLTATSPVQCVNPEGQIRDYPRRRGQKPTMGSLSWYALAPPLDLFPDVTPDVAQALSARSSPFAPPRAFGQVRDGDSVNWLGISPPVERDGARVSGVLIRRIGQGYAIFATFRLWSKWDNTDPLFELFHGSLLGRGAAQSLELGSQDPAAIQFIPTPSDGFEVLGVSPQATTATVRIPSPEIRLRTNCVLQSISTDPPTVFAYVKLTPMTAAVCDTVPVSIQPRSRNLSASLEDYSAKQIVFEMGAGSAAGTPGDIVDGDITVRDGVYPVAPGSEHEAVITEQGVLLPRRIWLSAGPDGVLRLSGPFAPCQIRIHPAPPVGDIQPSEPAG